jgi:hypothetical protein
VFPHQGNWFALYKLRITPGEGARQDRVLEYIAFCIDFNRRIADGRDHDFDEFDRFGDLTEASLWRVPSPDGGVMPMEGRMWFWDGQVAWDHPETPPSREMAANELWEQLAKHQVGV